MNPGNDGRGKAATYYHSFIRKHYLHAGVGGIMEAKLTRIAEISGNNSKEVL